VRSHDGNGLGHIHGAAAADPDDDVALAFQGQLRPFVGLLQGRLRQYPVVENGFHAFPVE